MNKTAVIVIGFCLLVLFGVPLFFQGDKDSPPADADRVIIITPHNEQIRYEFAQGFSNWYKKEFGEDAVVVWSVPGGTSEIRRMLQSQYAHALESGKNIGGEADLVFGGGSYEHGVLKEEITKKVNGEELTTTISVPAMIDQQFLDEVYGENVIGDKTVYDPEGYWHGLALSGFGIVYNNEVLHELGIDSPTTWDALCNPELAGRLALVNPAQSGSVTTAFEAILNNLGWERGWQILRRAAANARYFSASSLKPPADVSQGDATMGVCIDFYGRYQSQAVKSSGGGDRVGYVDPPGATMIDPDPISLLRGAPNEALALEFIKYCMTLEAQALWQFATDDNVDYLGPTQFELRRMPVRREIYTSYMDRMVDQVNPYETARKSPFPDRNMRAFISPLFSAMAMDNHDQLIDAWRAIVNHPAYPDTDEIVTAEDVDDPQLHEMLAAFDAMPAFLTDTQELESLETPTKRKAMKYGWLRDQWKDVQWVDDDGMKKRLWDEEDQGSNALKREASKFFKQNYKSIIEAKVR